VVALRAANYYICDLVAVVALIDYIGFKARHMVGFLHYGGFINF